MKTALIAFLVLPSSFAFAQGGKASTSPAAQQIDEACKADAATAGCGNDQVGTGLIKCIMAYKKEHRKDFKISDACKSALHSARAMKQQTK